MAVSYLRNTPITGKSYTTPVDATRRHNLRQWQIGRPLQILPDKDHPGVITVNLVNERGTSSSCPAYLRRVPKSRGRTLSCPYCQHVGHRDLVTALTIATCTPGGGPTTPVAVVLPEAVTHRRAGRHLPGAGQSRRDPAAHHRRREDQLARGGPLHHQVGVARLHGEDPQQPTGNPVNVKSTPH
ncbi:zinc ribbon domain-containing protein [Micromonospora mangrovi]|uniref:Zinc ribbon domain-containing protein n=2 Tax=Micromonospora TaxID=1873 RepID=A0AAU8HFL4_9ACTN